MTVSSLESECEPAEQAGLSSSSRLLYAGGRRRPGELMRVRLWGVRGSVPVPLAQAAGFGASTSCVHVSAGDGFCVGSGQGVAVVLERA
jgi:hypothetical protein